MKEINDITEELKSIGSKLAEMPRTIPYQVPQDYFNTFSAGIVFGISEKESFSNILPVDVEETMDVPQGYFDQLPRQILMKAKGEGILQQMPKANAYMVPEGYFEDLPTRMLWGVKEADVPKRKTIPLGERLGQSVRWLAAALLVLGIGFGSYQLLNKGTINTEEQLTALPSGTIQEYLQTDADEYIEMPEAIAGDVNVHKKELGQLSDAELINYLNETGLETTIN